MKWITTVYIPESGACFSSTYTKSGMVQRRLACIPGSNEQIQTKKCENKYTSKIRTVIINTR